MTKCNHDLRGLVGTADGIICRACGKTFKDFKELEADRPQPETPAVIKETPKRRKSKDG